VYKETITKKLEIMKTLDQNKKVYFRNDLVNYIDFDSMFESVNYENKKETRINIIVGTAILNVNFNDLNN
jgi:hypothetical protein